MALTDETYVARHTLRLGGTRYFAGDVIEGSAFVDNDQVARYIKGRHIDSASSGATDLLLSTFTAKRRIRLADGVYTAGDQITGDKFPNVESIRRYLRNGHVDYGAITAATLPGSTFLARHMLRIGGTTYLPGAEIPGSAFVDADHIRRYIRNGHLDVKAAVPISPPFDLSTASYDGVSFSVASEDTNPSGLVFSSDGTKMFVVGHTGDKVYQYALTEGFDLSTASYDDVSFSVATQDSIPQGLAFNAEGTKMFVVGSNSDKVYQYTLTVGFDLSTASYSGVSFSVATQEASPTGIAFNEDGTKMFVSGTGSDGFFQYTLTEGFDLSTASYSGVSFLEASSWPMDVVFSSDGTKMYKPESTDDKVYQYTLTEGFDLSTASADTSFSVATQESSPQAVTFNADGRKMFVVGSGSSTIYQYSDAS